MTAATRRFSTPTVLLRWPQPACMPASRDSSSFPRFQTSDPNMPFSISAFLVGAMELAIGAAFLYKPKDALAHYNTLLSQVAPGTASPFTGAADSFEHQLIACLLIAIGVAFLHQAVSSRRAAMFVVCVFSTLGLALAYIANKNNLPQVRRVPFFYFRFRTNLVGRPSSCFSPVFLCLIRFASNVLGHT